MFKEKFKKQISHLTKDGILANIEKSIPISKDLPKFSKITEPQATSLQNIHSAAPNLQEPRSNSHRLLYREPFNYPGVQKKENESYIVNFKKSNFHSEKTSPRNSAERREHHIISSPDSKINFHMQRLKHNHNSEEENGKLDKYKLNLDERKNEFDRDAVNFKHNQQMGNFLFDKKLEKFESSPKTRDNGLGLKNETKIIKMDRNYKDLCRERRDRSPFIESAKNQIINNNSRGWQREEDKLDLLEIQHEIGNVLNKLKLISDRVGIKN